MTPTKSRRPRQDDQQPASGSERGQVATRPLCLSVVVPGAAVPQGSTRAFIRGGKAITTSANKNLANWRALAALLLTEERERLGITAPYAGPVCLHITEFRLPPKGCRRVLPCVRPDLDKIDRAIGDVLVIAGILKDDALICEKHSAKLYGDRAEVSILVQSIGGTGE